MTFNLKVRAQAWSAVVLLLILIPCTSGAGRVDAQPTTIHSVILTTIDRLRSEGITSENAKNRHLQERFGNLLVQFDGEGRIGVTLAVREVTPALMAAIEWFGGNIEFAFPDVHLIAAWIPIDRIADVAGIDGVKIIRPMTGGVLNTGSVTSEGDSLHRAKNVRSELDIRGDSIRVGVISDGCTQWAVSQALGDLPAGYNAGHHTFLNGVKSGFGNEGTAMMEIISDLAPKGDLYFYGALGMGGGSATMVDAIRRLVREKRCRVIVDDLTYFDQPMFEDESDSTTWTIAAAARWAVDTGTVYVSSAGNWAAGGQTDRSHYQSIYMDINPVMFAATKPLPMGPIPAGYPPPWSELHDYNAGPAFDPGLRIIVPPGSDLYVILQWNDPWGLSADDYDLYLYDANIVTQKASSITVQAGASDPYEAVYRTNVYPYPETLNVLINHVTPVGPPKLLGMYIYMTPPGPTNMRGVEYNTAQNSIWGQPGADEVIAVGAVPYNNRTVIEQYSSNGNYDVYYPSYESRQKPDLVAIDGGAITGTGGFGSWDGVNWRFYGTSASAPHVAAMAALLLSSSPMLSPAQVHAKFERTANDLGAPGFDPIYGWGFLDIERSLLELNTTPGSYGPFTRPVSLNTPVFFSDSAGYAVGIANVTGGLAPPTSMTLRYGLTTGNPYADAGVEDLQCPTVKRRYVISQSGGTHGMFNAQVTLLAGHNEILDEGLDTSSVKAIFNTGSIFEVLSPVGLNTRINNTWKITAALPDWWEGSHHTFLGHLTRALDVSKVSDGAGQPDSVVEVKFKIRNDGNGWGMVSSSFWDSRGFPVMMTDSLVALNPASDTTVGVSVSIPGWAQVGWIDTIFVQSYLWGMPLVADFSYALVEVKAAPAIVDIHLEPGWNMISVPFDLADMSVSALFPSADPTAFRYFNGYMSASVLTCKKGYWLKVHSTDSVSFSGTKTSFDTVGIAARWNIIGCGSNTALVDSIVEDPPGIVASPFFGYDGSYQIVDTLYPGRAYWVKSTGAGNLILRAMDSTGSEPRAGPVQNPETLGELTFRDALGRAQMLSIYPSVLTEQRQIGELPPPPPDGAFDVRFSAQRLDESFDGNPREISIQLSGIVYPLSVAWKVRNAGISFELIDGNGIHRRMDNEGACEIEHCDLSSMQLRVSRRTGDALPVEFALDQNYPNPFNPVTIFPYAVPEQSRVVLKLFDLLGREVRTLVDEVQDQGRREVRLDAGDLPSGVYVYRLTAGSRSATRSCIIIR